MKDEHLHSTIEQRTIDKAKHFASFKTEQTLDRLLPKNVSNSVSIYKLTKMKTVRNNENKHCDKHVDTLGSETIV